MRITEEDKRNIRMALNRWYLCQGNSSLKYVYHEMLYNFYSITDENNLDSMEKTPSLSQFRYWAKKELDLQAKSFITRRPQTPVIPNN